MSIRYQEDRHVFTLDTLHSTYQMMVDSYGVLSHLYYGRKTDGVMDYLLEFADRGFSGNIHDSGWDRTYSLDVQPQEYPTLGTGDFRSTALHVKNGDGSSSVDLRYKGHEIRSGKYSIPGMPAVYAGEEEAQTLILHMEDPVTHVKGDLLYGVLPEMDVITRSVRVINHSDSKIYLEKIQTACLDFVQGSYDWMIFHGRHTWERDAQRTPIKHGAQVIGSRRGTSSHQYNPMIVVCDQETTEDAGSCWSMHFVYSGNFKAEAEMDQFDQTRILMGLGDEQFSYPVEVGDDFYAPEVMMCFSGEGLAALSHRVHDCIHYHVCRGRYRDGGRPVLLNSWEASYFNFSGESILNLAREAAGLGVDMLVMDDGWFGKRNDDNSGLGDWFVNESKLGMPLGEMVRRINDMGLKFGIWFEPECVNEDSDLFREHPDWALTIPGRKPVRARNQLVLDFSRREVVDYIYDSMCKVLDQANIEYVKWDLNRSLMDVFSRDKQDQGRVHYDYMMGLYDMLERLLARYPNLLLEGCSGGGGRFDAGMLYYSPQIWCSDNTDAMDRLNIQYGTSFGYPACTVASHISASPNHQVGRETPLKTRGIVAMGGTFGYELNPYYMSEEEKADVRHQIEEYRRYEHLIYHGRYYRLSVPGRDSLTAWAFVSKDQREALVSAVVTDIHGNMPGYFVKIRGLMSGHRYKDEATQRVYHADALMQMGFHLDRPYGDYCSYQIHLIRED